MEILLYHVRWLDTITGMQSSDSATGVCVNGLYQIFSQKWNTGIYMYLKTYAKFTFCIKFQGHVSDENFLYYCMHLASKINFFLRCLKYVRQKESLLFTVKVFNIFRYVPQNIHGHFQSYFQNGYTRTSETTFAFYCIKLSH